MVLTFHRDNFMRRVTKIVPASGINSMVPWLSRALRCHCLEGMGFCLALAHLTLIQQTSGVNVTASLGGG